VYHSDFNPSYYHDLLKLADGKPVTLAEVGPPPTVDILKQQPKWTWWMQWAGMEGRGESTSNAVQALFNDPRSYSLSDPGYRRAITPVRTVAGLPPLTPVAATATH
jgi:mannan endo-1,4-beta-mannosidase